MTELLVPAGYIHHQQSSLEVVLDILNYRAYSFLKGACLRLNRR
jgi:hypothetical protein